MSTASDRPRNVLFLCTGNSARSILAEVLIGHWGRGRFKGYSAGSVPKGTVNPLTLELLRRVGLPVDGLRSKGWEEFVRPGSPPMDFVFTVCDLAAGEACPAWPGDPVTAHWRVPDPVAVEGTDEQRAAAFAAALYTLEARIKLFINLPLAALDRLAIHRETAEIGRRSLNRAS